MSNETNAHTNPVKQKPWLTFVASLLPVVAFAIFEEVYGTKAGLVAGVVLAIGEIAYEWKVLGRPQNITIVANALVLALGGLSLYESNPTFFKLQPAILVFVFAGILIGSSLIGKPFLVALMKKQRPDLNEMGVSLLGGLNLRMGIALVFAGLVGVYAAFEWPTAWWATYKAIGVPVFLIAYMFLDVVIWKRQRRKSTTL